MPNAPPSWRIMLKVPDALPACSKGTEVSTALWVAGIANENPLRHRARTGQCDDGQRGDEVAVAADDVGGERRTKGEQKTGNRPGGNDRKRREQEGTTCRARDSRPLHGQTE